MFVLVMVCIDASSGVVLEFAFCADTVISAPKRAIVKTIINKRILSLLVLLLLTVLPPPVAQCVPCKWKRNCSQCLKTFGNRPRLLESVSGNRL
jgi:hypothetical protein